MAFNNNVTLKPETRCFQWVPTPGLQNVGTKSEASTAADRRSAGTLYLSSVVHSVDRLDRVRQT